MTDDGEKSKGGRPSKFDPAFIEQAEKLCLLGATDEQMADFFGVAVSTVSLWKVEHPEFSEALRNGKTVADAKVASALYAKATGYEYKIDKVVGKGDSARVVQLTVMAEPDVTAQIFWLKNRRSKEWRDARLIGGDPDNPVHVEVRGIADEIRDRVARIAASSGTVGAAGEND